MSKTKQPRWFVKRLIKLGACTEAIEYAQTHRTFPAAWQECRDASWLRWLITGLYLSPPAHDMKRAPANCPGCKWDDATPGMIRRHFTAEQVAKALRRVL